ncbi:MAG TPA: hypothetical protein VJN18_04365 [Polyangiaceae bacterium]|nr:hypothetical protein [Polyangiaceae bacterium]
MVTIACDRSDRYFSPIKWEALHLVSPMQSPWTFGNIAIPESVLALVEQAGRAAYEKKRGAIVLSERPRGSRTSESG